jgi:nicotinamide-nucleotide amidase
MNISIVSIGNELLIGQVINTNAAWLGERLSELGIAVIRALTVGDEYQAIQDALAYCLRDSQMVITTGGLGPTKDDISKKAIADLFHKSLNWHQPSFDRLEAYFIKRNYPISEAHRAQCFMPEGAQVLENDLGTAPGLRLHHEGKDCYMLPGVPYEMKHLFERHILPEVHLSSDQVYFKKTFHTAGTGETVISDHITVFEDNLPENASIAYLPSLGTVRVRLNARGVDEATFTKWTSSLKELLKPWLFGEDDTSLQRSVIELLKSNGLELVLAESCTGGNIASILVGEPGVSSVFKGSAVVYSNELKHQLLGVPMDVIDSYGAVSEEVVSAMVKGALKHLGGDIAAAVSGIAGPDGGTEEKPVGTVWLAVGNKDHLFTHKVYFNKDRTRNIAFSTITALNMIRRFVIKYYYVKGNL